MLRPCFLVLALAAPALAGGLSLTVNSTLDLPDADLQDGVCDADLETEGEQITLRAAIMHCNTIVGPDVIELPPGLYKLTIQGHDEDGCATGDLDITEDLVIEGEDMVDTIIDGKKAKDRVFDVLEGAEVLLAGFTVRKGAAPTKDIDDQRGGGIRNSGALELSLVTVTKCKTGDADGGGISNEGGTLDLHDSIISKNRAGSDGGGVDVAQGEITIARVSFVKNKSKSDGGGLECSPATGTIENCTFSANSAAGIGGALSVNDGAEIEVLNCTLAKNKAKQGGSGIGEDITDAEDSISIANCIVANKKTTNYAGDGMISLGDNLDSGSTCGFDDKGDLEDADPRLLKLTNVPGDLPVHPLKPDSPCIDEADDALAPAADQLGNAGQDVPDVGSALRDIGAVEFLVAGDG
jgi:predicted outer membrane repeat protein